MKKIILTAAIAAALTLSCAPAEDEGDNNGDKSSGSNSGGGGSNSSGTTETYTLTYADEDDEYFSYMLQYEWDYCEEGVLETGKDSSEIDQYYSIDKDNKIMIFGNEYDYMYGDTLRFKGSTDELKGTWTRKKSSCKLITDYDYPYNYCKENYDITKAVFTDDKVTITREECLTDREVNGNINEYNGYKTKVVDCNTLEYSKGSEKITKTITKTGEKISYNGKVVCENEPTKPQKQAACKAAWDEYGDDDYRFILWRAYNDCQFEKLPEDYTGYGGDGGGDYCEDSDGIFDFCDCYNECLCADYEDEFYTNWCEEGFAAKAAKPASAKIFKAKTSKLKPLLKKKK